MLISLTYLKLKEMSRKHNIEKAKKLIKTAKERGAKLIILPSLFPVGNTFEIYNNEKKMRSVVKNLAEKIPDNSTDILVKLAMEGEIHLIAGPLLEQAGPKIFLTTLVISPDGEIIGKYRKIMMSEKDVKLGISGGKEPIYVVLDKKYGVLSEDDLFSPEISRILALGGSQLIIGTTRPVNKKQDLIKYVAITRSVENGISYLINGEMIENEDGEIVGYTPTFIATPDSLVYKEAEDEDSIVLVESSMITQNKEGVNTRLNGIESIIYGLCKSIKKTKMNEKPIPKPEG
ncbi:Nitrilase/cyanide hydratase and apolipoprotein N-acyltransferase [Acidianus hospitalis W1]|uniref:Nitrilase/cyanide hydratase and apolipoprotein N-acyltransferase n=1 Tax=Acidianus hospitalis (strain W1) TaxID=933801 RepID=F4B7I8_ACIHW|nr:carbon-nitrogen hydrolase family protein [Acidianus hospitalis]AEE93593.1 Nitrilase/cyanide hydratase and apolipoprotein N-acyltransferase [Acidianus hospitalis W1]